MRTLATGTYTAEQVEARLRSSAAVDTMTCDVLDRDLNVIGDLTQNITEAVVDLDVDRAVKGSLKLTVTPHDLPDPADFPTAWFRYYVRPNWCLRMPDGGTATYPMGIGSHTWQATAASGSSIGMKGMIFAAQVLGATAHDLMTRPESLAAAREEFDKAVAGEVYIAAKDLLSTEEAP